MIQVTMTLEQYEALSSLARQGQPGDLLRRINALLQEIEKSNGITRSFMHVQWQELGAALPAGTRFPDRWPPELRCTVERTDRPVSRADVDAVLASKARRPTNILVTIDPGGELGWMSISDYFRG